MNNFLSAGLVLVNKPKGISSNTVVNIVKKAVGATKAGHLGTLDLEGEGLLPILLNKATQLFDYYLNKDKVYKTTFEFGICTTTLDLEGEVVKRDNKIISKQDIEKVIPSLLGKYPQMPPNYSAKRINGKRAYDLARKGEQVELKSKKIEVYSIKLLKEITQNVFEFEIHCSSGTYIRSIARDMAEKLSTYGVMQCIQRTKCGDFDLKDAFSLEDIKNGNYEIIPIEKLFDYDKLYLSKGQADKLLQGATTKFDKDGLFKVYFNNEFLGIVEVKDGLAKKFKYRFV